MGELLGFPSNRSAIPKGADPHPFTSGPRIIMMPQGINSLVNTLTDFLRRKHGRTPWHRSPPPGVAPIRPVAVVGLVTNDGDRQLLAGKRDRNRWHLLFVETSEEARTALDQLKVPVILCDRDLPGPGWRETVAALASSPHRTCIILVSGVVDAYLWDEVVRAGGYDVLSKPLREDDVIRAVRLALSYWSSATKSAPIPGKRHAGET